MSNKPIVMVPDEFVDSSIATHTVGFLGSVENKIQSFGSGVLVEYKGQKGILTCAHVIVELTTKLNDVGFVLFGPNPERRQATKLSVSYLSEHHLGAAPWSIEGPDMGYLALPASTASTIASIGSFLNLELQVNEAARPWPLGPSVSVIASGVVGEWTNDVGAEKSLIVEGMCKAGRARLMPAQGGYDRLHFVPRKDRQLPKINSYGGMSGGGLWGIARVNVQGEVSWKRRLMGINFWETGIRNRKRRLVSHTFADVAKVLLPRIENLA